MTNLQKIAIGILGSRVMRDLRFMLAALAIGSRTVALADNSQLRRDLGARAGALYGTDED